MKTYFTSGAAHFNDEFMMAKIWNERMKIWKKKNVKLNKLQTTSKNGWILNFVVSRVHVRSEWKCVKRRENDNNCD